MRVRCGVDESLARCERMRAFLRRMRPLTTASERLRAYAHGCALRTFHGSALASVMATPIPGERHPSNCGAHLRAGQGLAILRSLCNKG